MKVGILSDTHDQTDLALVAARQLIFRGVEIVFHCGDIGSEALLIEMASLFHLLNIPLYAVLGNCDSQLDYRSLQSNIGVRLFGRFGEVNIAGNRIAFLHSDDEVLFETIIQSNDYNYIFYGHSHARCDKKVEQTRVINPGSAGRGMHPSCAVLDLANDGVSFFTLHCSK